MSRYPLLIALLLAGAAHAAMYKWVDADGNVQYTAFPPPDRPATTVAPPPRVAPPPAKPKADDDKAKPAEEEQEQTPEEVKRMAEAYRKNCEGARRNLEIYRSARRIKQGDEYIYLDDAMREKGMAEAQANIDKYCE